MIALICLKKRFFAAIIAIIMVLSCTLPAAAQEQFLDIKNHWAQNYIEQAAQNHWFQGIGDGQFAPDQTMTRAMFVVVMANYNGCHLSTGSVQTKFRDVSPYSWYAPAVKWASDAGIISGTSSTTFSPNAPITREQIAVLLINYSNAVNYALPRVRSLKLFADSASCADWALDAVCTLYRAGVVDGTKNYYYPKSSATRAECAAMLCKYASASSKKATAAQQMPLVNHRGYHVTAGENTIPAYEQSAANGYRYIEADVRFTKDNVPVLLHDTTINRTSNGKGSITSLTYRQVLQYNFGGGAIIGTYENLLKLCAKSDLYAYIELKSTMTQQQIKQLLSLAAQYNMQNKITWISFSADNLKKVCQTFAYASIGYLSKSATDQDIRTVTALQNGKNTVSFSVQYNSDTFTAAQRAKLIRKQIHITVWTVNWNNGGYKTCLKFANSIIESVTTDDITVKQLYPS